MARNPSGPLDKFVFVLKKSEEVNADIIHRSYVLYIYIYFLHVCIYKHTSSRR